MQEEKKEAVRMLEGAVESAKAMLLAPRTVAISSQLVESDDVRLTLSTFCRNFDFVVVGSLGNSGAIVHAQAFNSQLRRCRNVPARDSGSVRLVALPHARPGHSIGAGRVKFRNVIRGAADGRSLEQGNGRVQGQQGQREDHDRRHADRRGFFPCSSCLSLPALTPTACSTSRTSRFED